jgi:hypothetical protein
MYGFPSLYVPQFNITDLYIYSILRMSVKSSLAIASHAPPAPCALVQEVSARARQLTTRARTGQLHRPAGQQAPSSLPPRALVPLPCPLVLCGLSFAKRFSDQRDTIGRRSFRARGRSIQVDQQFPNTIRSRCKRYTLLCYCRATAPRTASVAGRSARALISKKGTVTLQRIGWSVLL